VDRLYTADPRTDADAHPITDVHHPAELARLQEGAGDGGRWGTGGMTTKLAAARIATASGITVHLADGRHPEVLEKLLSGGRGGTVFHPHPEPLGNRKSWLAHALRPQGDLRLDNGACNALEQRGASLLEVARGLSSWSSEALQRALTQAPANASGSPVVVHRDALVLTTPTIRPQDT
jgi:glutamate 5-kinase